METELRIQHLSAAYLGENVLSDITAAFPAAAFSAILGPNGAGKTSLLRCICGYLAARSGSISLGGADLRSLSSRERAQRIALVPQLAADFAALRVREAVLLARYPHAASRFRASLDDHRIADEAIAALLLEPLAGRLCSELSGGELRRVLIAQGLAQQPQVLLLDEPTAFLDPPAQHEILRIVRELAESRGITAVAVLHDPRLAGRYCSHVLLLRAGCVVHAGPASDSLSPELLASAYGCSVDDAMLLEALR